MPRIEPIPWEDLTAGRRAEIETGMQSGAYTTQVPLQIFAYADHDHVPDDGDRHPQFPGSLLPGRLLEMLRIRSGQVNGCEPCMSSRKVDSITEADVACMVDPALREDLSERERLALLLVDLMATDHHGIGDDLVRDLASVFTTAEIVELGQFCGQMIGAHRFMHVLDVFGDGEPVIRYDPGQVGVSWAEAHAAAP
ncbi:MAG TPA: hypothetical protein VMU76_04350 [Acidimicrobiales bacterium]|nr:hypothetical protein [Acidimicrobiales bacterium]